MSLWIGDVLCRKTYFCESLQNKDKPRLVTGWMFRIISSLPLSTWRILTETPGSCLLGWALVGTQRPPEQQSLAVPQGRGATVAPGGCSGLLCSHWSWVRHQPQPSPSPRLLCARGGPLQTPKFPQAVAGPPSTTPAWQCCPALLLPLWTPQRKPRGEKCALCLLTYSQKISLLCPSFIPVLPTVAWVLEQQELEAQEASWIQENSYSDIFFDLENDRFISLLMK